MPVFWSGCDNTNANVGGVSGLKAQLQEDIPWAIVTCFAHMLELSIKDDHFFKDNDELCV